MKYKSLEEIKKNTVQLKLQSKGTEKKQLGKQFLSLTEEEKKIAIDLFESLKLVMENILKEKKTHHQILTVLNLFLLYKSQISTTDHDIITL